MDNLYRIIDIVISALTIATTIGFQPIMLLLLMCEIDFSASSMMFRMGRYWFHPDYKRLFPVS
jgi:hypothetical protein